MSERITVTAIFHNTKPQKVLGAALGVDAPYTSEVVKGGMHPGPKMTARLAARVLIPKFGRAYAAEILLASLEDRHPEEFACPEPVGPGVLEQIWPKAEATTVADAA